MDGAHIWRGVVDAAFVCCDGEAARRCCSVARADGDAQGWLAGSVEETDEPDAAGSDGYAGVAAARMLGV